MIPARDFLDCLLANEIRFFAGVPDSLMKGFLLQLQMVQEHVITANEGNAVAMAAGYHLATGKTAMVYMQNSGLGNAINPLTSLANKEVYGVPMLLLIGWRGEPGKKDEPQHMKMGSATMDLLQLLEIPAYVLGKQQKDWYHIVSAAAAETQSIQHPVAIVVEEGCFEEHEATFINPYTLKASEVIEHIYTQLDGTEVVVATTGKISRLFYELNKKNNERISKFFMNAGAMGHSASVAAAIALFRDEKVLVIDGDGALLMHMGTLAVSAQLSRRNFHYLLLNNGAHQSVGSQPTVGFQVDFCAIAGACGFNTTRLISTSTELASWQLAAHENGFTEFRINTMMPASLPRPAESFEELKNKFREAMKQHEPGSNHS